MFANIMLQSTDKKTVPVGLMNFQGMTTTNWTLVVASMVIASPAGDCVPAFAEAVRAGAYGRKRERTGGCSEEFERIADIDFPIILRKILAGLCTGLSAKDGSRDDRVLCCYRIFLHLMIVDYWDVKRITRN